MGLGYYSYLFLGNSILLYFVGSLLNCNNTQEYYQGEEIMTSTMTRAEKEKVTGLVIWRNHSSSSVGYWCRERQQFSGGVAETHNLCDYEAAAAHAKGLVNSGMLYFLHDQERFPKDRNLMN
jgi:hypothetical protein